MAAGSNTSTDSPQDPDVTTLIPPDAFDSHMHIIDNRIQALSSARTYTPPAAPLASALDTLAPLFPQLCIVQPSIYGLDNSCTLAALEKLGKQRACAVIVVDPDNVTEEQMRIWDESGVRGVRINLVSEGIKPDGDKLVALVKSHAELIRPWGWVLQLYTPMSSMYFLTKIIPSLGVPVVLDHFATPTYIALSTSSSPAGFTSLMQAFNAPGSQLYIKISAPYRTESPLEVLRTLFAILYRTGPDRLIFATDWPHTRFDGYNTAEWIKTVVEWCMDIGGNDAVVKVFKTNAERLWRGNVP